MRGYKEDSTRGRSLLIPKSYKRDSLVQVWIDRRKLAVLSQWLDESGLVTRHLSDVLRFTIDQVVEKLITDGIVRKVEFTDEATRILESKYQTELNTGGKGEKNLLHNMQLDEIRRSRFYGEGEIDVRPRMDSVKEAEVRALADKAVEMYRELERTGGFKSDKERMEREHEETMNGMREKFKVDDSGVVVVERGRIDEVDGEDDESLVQPKMGKSSDVMRSRSKEEILSDIEEINKRDRELAEMDMSAPRLR